MTETSESLTAPTCVVIDSNEWIRLKWLGSPVGLTFLWAMTSNPELKLAIPEVLELELDKHRTETARDLLDKLKGAVAEINTVAGGIGLGGLVTATEEDIDVAIRERLTAIREQVLYPEMDLGQARRALHRVNAGTPPNGPKNQQMKDSLLWEACVDLAATCRVFFVTGDKAFYAQGERKLPAPNLAAEEPVRHDRLKLYSALEQAIPAFAPQAAVVAGEVAQVGAKELIAQQALQGLRRSPIVADLQASITLRGVVPSYLRTQTPHVFAVSFGAIFLIEEGREGGRHGEAHVSGQCRYDARRASLEAFDLESIHWTLTDQEGYTIKTRELPDAHA